MERIDEIQLLKEMRAAVRAGDLQEVRRLIQGSEALLHRMTAFGTWLHVAAKAGQLETAKELIALGVDVNARGGTFGGAAINLAASAGQLEVIELLIEAGAELDVSDPVRNPLFGAIYGGHLDIVKFLIDCGIDHCVRYSGESMKDMDAHAFAVERGQSEIAEYLATLYSSNG